MDNTVSMAAAQPARSAVASAQVLQPAPSARRTIHTGKERPAAPPVSMESAEFAPPALSPTALSVQALLLALNAMPHSTFCQHRSAAPATNISLPQPASNATPHVLPAPANGSVPPATPATSTFRGLPAAHQLNTVLLLGTASPVPLVAAIALATPSAAPALLETTSEVTTYATPPASMVPSSMPPMLPMLRTAPVTPARHSVLPASILPTASPASPRTISGEIANVTPLAWLPPSPTPAPSYVTHAPLPALSAQVCYCAVNV